MSENGSTALSLEQILSSQPAENRRVPFGEGYILVRAGSISDKARVERAGKVDGGMDPYLTRRALLREALVKDDGSPLLASDQDADKLLRARGLAPKLEPVIDVAMQQFGFTDDDKVTLDDLEKNSTAQS